MRQLVILTLLFLSSCQIMDMTLHFLLIPTDIANDSFFIKSGDDKFYDEIEIQRLNQYGLVHKKNDNSIIISGGGKAAIRVEMAWENYEDPIENETDMQFYISDYKNREAQTFDFGLIRENDDPFSIAIRSTPTDIKTNDHLILEFFSNEYILKDSDSILASGILPEFEPGKVYRVIIMNDSKKIKVSYDCDEIVDINTEYPITDYLILQNEGISSVELNALSINRTVPKHIFD